MTTDQAHHALARARAKYELRPTHWNLCTLERAERQFTIVQTPHKSPKHKEK